MRLSAAAAGIEHVAQRLAEEGEAERGQHQRMPAAITSQGVLRMKA